MAGNTYIHATAGVLTETAAIQATAGVGDAGKIVALNASGVIDSTMLSGGFSGPVAADLIVGDLAYVTSAGIIAAAQASAISTIAQGFVVVAGTVSPAVNATIAFSGEVTGVNITGFTPGVELYLSAAAGKVFTTTAPTAVGTVVQPLGFAVTASEVHFDRQRVSQN